MSGFGIYIDAHITPEIPLYLPDGKWRVERMERVADGAYVRLQKIRQGARKAELRRRGMQ